MLTAKFLHSGGESIIEASRVFAVNDPQAGSLRVFYDLPTDPRESEAHEFTGTGTVYVMNERGDTIARYPVGEKKATGYRYPPAPTAEENRAIVAAEPRAI